MELFFSIKICIWWLLVISLGQAGPTNATQNETVLKSDVCMSKVAEDITECDTITELHMQHVLGSYNFAKDLLAVPESPEIWSKLSLYSLSLMKDDEECNTLVSSIDQALLKIASHYASLTLYLEVAQRFSDELTKVDTCLYALSSLTSAVISRYPGGELVRQVLDAKNSFAASIQEKSVKAIGVLSNVAQKNYQLLLSHVIGSNYTGAAMNFNRIGTPQLLAQLVAELLSLSGSQAPNILEFAYELEDIIYRFQTYQLIAREIQKNPAAHVTNILALKTKVDDDLSRCKEDNVCPPTHQLVEALTNGLFNYYKASVPASICDGKYLEIVNAVSPNWLTFLGDAFTPTLEDIITNTVTKCLQTNLESILNFVDDLNWNIHKATAFVYLYHRASLEFQSYFRFHEIITQTAKSLNGPDIDNKEEAENILNAIDFPKLVLALQDSSQVKIKTSDDRCIVLGKKEENNPANLPLELDPTCDPVKSTWTLKKVLDADSKYMLYQSNNNLNKYLSSHIPWKNEDDDTGIVSASQEGTLSPNRHYIWEILNKDELMSSVTIFHEGRKALLTLKNDKVFLDLTSDFQKDTNVWEVVAANDAIH